MVALLVVIVAALSSACGMRRCKVENEIDLGPCCACGVSGPRVRNILMYDFRAPVSGYGWGCFMCGLPQDGAVAVLCDACIESKCEPTEICSGALNEHGRVALAGFERVPFEHILKFHQAEEVQRQTSALRPPRRNRRVLN